MGLGITLKSVTFMAPLSIFLRQLPYCHVNVLSHSYCLHSDLIQLPCADTKLSSILACSPLLHTLMSSIYLFVPPVLNPIIYSVKTKPIRQGIFTLFSCKRKWL
ncbi:hypothetical protein GH733_001490 [Mirounga leonina]|nr:hypothetical protein GH733_001490 [Mirounga leonina]